MRNNSALFLMLSVFALSLSLAGCGGGGGTSASPAPTLSGITPTTASAGSTGVTLTASGSGFGPSSVVNWNYTALATTYVSDTTLTAKVPASDLTSVGPVSIWVSNPGGGMSSSATFKVTPELPPGVNAVYIQANSLAWDPVNQVIYLSLPSVDGANGNMVQAVNPTTGALGASADAGSEPNLLSVSANSKYLYVSLGGTSNVVQRMTLPALVKDIAIPMGNDGYGGLFYALDVQAAPNADGTVAIASGYRISAYLEPGVILPEELDARIYDDGVARPNAVSWSHCSGQISCRFNSIQWNADASMLFAADYYDSGYDFYTVPVNAQGFGTVTDYPGTFRELGYDLSIHFDPVTGYVYDNDGQVINPSNGSVVGTFAASGLMVPDGALGRAYFIGLSSSFGTINYTIKTFDIRNFTQIASVTIPSVTIPNVAAYPTHLIRWGSSGLAFTTGNNYGTDGAVYILSGAFVDGDSAALATAPTKDVQRTWESGSRRERLNAR